MNDGTEKDRFLDLWTEDPEVAGFVVKIGEEVLRARKLFPQPNALLAALHEESGEVANAVMDEPWDAVVGECVQAAAMACRLATERDPTMEPTRAKTRAEEVYVDRVQDLLASLNENTRFFSRPVAAKIKYRPDGSIVIKVPAPQKG